MLNLSARTTRREYVYINISLSLSLSLSQRSTTSRGGVLFRLPGDDTGKHNNTNAISPCDETIIPWPDLSNWPVIEAIAKLSSTVSGRCKGSMAALVVVTNAAAIENLVSRISSFFHVFSHQSYHFPHLR